MGTKLFVTSAQEKLTPGVYAIEQSPPQIIRGISNGYIGFIGKFAWGPVFTGTLPESGDDLLQTFEPTGSPRQSSGYRAIMGRRPATWFIVGVKGAGYATSLLSTAGTGGNLVVTAKWPGVLGNSITREIAAASGGDATKRDIIIRLSDPITGTRTERYRDIALNVSPNVTASRLIASIVFSGGTMTVFPANGTANLAAGSDGAALVAGEYQTALDELDLEDQVRIVVADDPGDSIRAAVNTNILNNVINNANRVTFLQGDPDNTWTQVKADKATYVNERACYMGAWVSVQDDEGVLRQSPLSTIAATCRNRISVHLSIARHSSDNLAFYNPVIRAIDAAFSTNSDVIQEEATAQGIMLPKRLPSGQFALVHGRTTDTTSGRRFEVTRWYRDYLALSLVPQLGSFTNGPNDESENLEIKGTIERFMNTERDNRRVVSSKDDAGVLRPAYVVDIDSLNSASTLANGDFFVLIEARTPGVRERTFLVMNVGETVTVRVPQST